MTIKSIVIEGMEGDIDISRTTTGAHAMLGHVCIAHITREETAESRYAKAKVVAGAIYGTGRKGNVNATNSMIHGVLQEMERVAGC